MLLKVPKYVLITQPCRSLVKKPRGVLSKVASSATSKALKDDRGPPYTHFVQIGDPVLRERCSPVPKEEINTKEIQAVLQHMIYTLERYDGVGISAPQIGVPLQIIAIQFTRQQLDTWSDKIREERKMEEIPRQIFINPSISVLDNSQITEREGCCSLHGLSCRVSRFATIRLKALDHTGDEVELTASNWTSRIIQHEMDHLSGTLISDKMEPASLSMDYWKSVNARGGDFRLSFAGMKAGPTKWFANSRIWKSFTSS